MLRELLTAVALLALASAALAGEDDDCFQGLDPRQRIQSCSELIERVPGDAAAYHNRAFAHGLAGDLDSAIADYSKVIAIAPSTASAYANRGRAYASRGDHAHAVADTIKAEELIARASAAPVVKTPPKPPAVKKTVVAAKKTVVAAKKAAPAPKEPVQPKEKGLPRASNVVGQDAPSGSWWSWLWGLGFAGNPKP
jgi:tetratricopeptide (TPR) repeat protein